MEVVFVFVDAEMWRCWRCSSFVIIHGVVMVTMDGSGFFYCLRVIVLLGARWEFWVYWNWSMFVVEQSYLFPSWEGRVLVWSMHAFLFT